MAERIQTYQRFYQFYLTEHQNPISRMFHFTGTFLVFVLLVLAWRSEWSWGWLLLPMIGYGFAWIGHTFFEKNKPATFRYPL